MCSLAQMFFLFLNHFFRSDIKIVKLEKSHTIIGNNHYIRFLSTILPVTFCISLKHWHSIESVSEDNFFKFFFFILHKCHFSLMLPMIS